MDNKVFNRIINAGTSLIFQFGIKGWNMNDCANDAGITKRTLYKYMKSKESLVEYVLLDFVRKTQKELSGKLEKEPDYLKGIEIILNDFPPMIMKFNTKIIKNIFIEYPDIKYKLVKERAVIASDILEFISKGQVEGFIKKSIEPKKLLEILQSLVIYYMTNNPEEVDKELKSGFNIVLNGILTGEQKWM